MDAFRRSAPALLLLLLAAAWFVPEGTAGARLSDGGSDASAQRWRAAIDALDAEPTVLVAFDPDLGTYPEIRPTVRAALAELLAADARLAFVALTPEGRALLLAELARFGRLEVNAARILDLGFVPGAEAAIVSLASGPRVPDPAEGALAGALREEGVGVLDAALVVGGNDLGPRSWVEQFAPRAPGIPLLAIAPTVLLPELLPYEESGQLAAVLATPGDGAAYREAAELGSLERLTDPATPSAAIVLVGLLAAFGALAQAWLVRVARRPGAPDAEGRGR